MSNLKGYYLPKSLKSLEKEMEFSEKRVNDYTLLLPNINQDNIKEIVSGLKENRKKYLARYALP